MTWDLETIVLAARAFQIDCPPDGAIDQAIWPW